MNVFKECINGFLWQLHSNGVLRTVVIPFMVNFLMFFLIFMTFIYLPFFIKFMEGIEESLINSMERMR